MGWTEYDIVSALRAQLAQSAEKLAALTAKQPINTHVRLFDLVRQQRSELHQADLITDEEYAWLCSYDPLNGTKPGSPSRMRLEDYDQLREKLAACEGERNNLVKELNEVFGWSDGYLHALLHIKNAVENLRADLAVARNEVARLEADRDALKAKLEEKTA